MFQLDTEALVTCLNGQSLSSDITLKPPNNKLLMIISSTFTDTMDERNLILGEISVYLQQVCKQKGLDVDVKFVDMRYGVRDENTLDHMTWVACCAEIERCEKESSGVFFISLQGEKYGYQMAPKLIPQAQLDERLSKIDPEMTLASLEVVKKPPEGFDPASVKVFDFFKEWYVLDENAIPPRYELKHLKEVNDPLYWDVALPMIVEVLKDLSFDPQRDENLLVARSVTEYETRVALSTSEKAEKCFWFHRVFKGGVPKDDSMKWWLYDDTLANSRVATKLSHLKMFMKERLSKNMKEYTEVPLSSLIAKDTAYQEYLQTFQRDFTDVIMGDVEKVYAVYKAWNTDGCGVGLNGADLNEMLHHVQWAQEKIRSFEGREMLVESCINVLSKKRPIQPGNDNKTTLSNAFQSMLHHVQWAQEKIRSFVGREMPVSPSNAFQSISLAMVGKSGSGKTALASFVAKSVLASSSSCPLVIRFCGTTTNSNDGFSLVRSMCLQMNYLFHGDWKLAEVEGKTSYDELVSYFHRLLKEHPVLLVIDSLDQLTNNYKEQSELSFLKGVRPHPKGKIIVTTLPYDDKYHYLCEKKLSMSSVSMVEVAPLVQEGGDVSGIKALTETILTKRGRKLTDSQWQIFEQSVLEEPTALYMNLSLYFLQKWQSTSPVEELTLRPTVPALINQIFDDLCRDFGEVLVNAILAYLSFAVGGLTDTEIVDLLSIDDDVLKFVFQYSTPTIYRLPYHVWLRVKSALGPLLVEKEGGAWPGTIGNCERWGYSGAMRRRASG